MEMIIGQLQYFGASFLYGVLLMFVYDFVRVFRCKVRHPVAARLAEDWIFWLVAAIFVFQMIFALNNGIMRSFFVVSFVGGLVSYRKLMKDHLVHAILAVIHFIFRPYVWIRKKLGKIHKKPLK